MRNSNKKHLAVFVIPGVIVIVAALLLLLPLSPLAVIHYGTDAGDVLNIEASGDTSLTITGMEYYEESPSSSDLQIKATHSSAVSLLNAVLSFKLVHHQDNAQDDQGGVLATLCGGVNIPAGQILNYILVFKRPSLVVHYYAGPTCTATGQPVSDATIRGKDYQSTDSFQKELDYTTQHSQWRHSPE